MFQRNPGPGLCAQGRNNWIDKSVPRKGVVFMSLILSKNAITEIGQILQAELLDSGAEHVMIIDMSGNLVLDRGALEMDDILALAVLSAANFAATAEIAKLLGEDDFMLLFHKGDKRNMHFNRLGKEHIIIALFDDGIPVGLMRLRSNNAVERVAAVMFEGS
jgi:predicted regulator of Ras-like GTPase activity (Roadblock/LC7/MglB family)